jgi:DNA repair/transcription protein MET18/MMS19
MGDESLIGIVDLMTGEKDPRNLMLVFSILKVVMMEWDLTGHADVRSISNASVQIQS